MTSRLFLAARQPFSLRPVVQSHGWVQLAPFRELDGGEAFAYALRLPEGAVGDVIVRSAPGGVEATTDASLGPAGTEALSSALKWMLGLDQDLQPFYAVAAREPKLAHVSDAAHGRILRSATLFEDVIKTILTTNTTWGSTKRMVSALVGRFGEPVPGEEGVRAFPSPEAIAASSVAILRDEVRLGYRAPYVLDTARRIADGSLDLEALKAAELPTPELRKELLAVQGVGPYAAANLLMLLGRTDYIPVDSWAMKMVSLEWHNGAPVGPAEVEAAFARWGEWKGMAFWFWSWSDQS